MEPSTSAASTMPGSAAWFMASTSIDCRRSTRKVPGSAHMSAVASASTKTVAKLIAPPASARTAPARTGD